MRKSLEERFWSKVRIGSPDECWLWQRGTFDSGYGQFRVAMDASPQRSSRVAWELTNGPISGDLLVCHRCDTPPCCNPSHLFLGTHADNNRDRDLKGRTVIRVDMEVLIERMRRLTDAEVHQIRRDHAAGESCRSIARRFGVARTTISRLVRGIHWKETS